MPSTNLRMLSAVLIAFGLTFCMIYPLSIIWPSGWAWQNGAAAMSDQFMIIIGVYAVLGISMILASRDPAASTSLIWFVVWSSLVHALIAGWEAMRSPMMKGHFYGDVPALLLAAIVLGSLMSRGVTAEAGATA
jgi:hypothetical protein